MLHGQILWGLKQRFMTAGDETKAGSGWHIYERGPRRNVAAIDVSSSGLIIVVRVAKPRWEFEPAVVTMKVLRGIVLRHHREITVKQTRGIHCQPRHNSHNVRIHRKVFKETMPILDMSDVCFARLLSSAIERRWDVGFINCQPMLKHLQHLFNCVFWDSVP